MWIWNVIQYLSRSPFFIQFPNRAPVVIYTDCGAVNFITRSKNSLSYQIELYDSLTDPCWTHLQIFKVILKGKYFSDKNLFCCHSEWSGQSGTTEFDWADNVSDCWHRGYCQLDTRSGLLCAQCQVSIILSQECKLLQSSVLWIFNSKVSCLGWARWARSNIDRSFARIEQPWNGLSLVNKARTDKPSDWLMRWLARDHTFCSHWLQSYLISSDHTQQSVEICSKVLTGDYNSANRAGSCMRSAYPGQECCREQEDIPAECELELIGNMRHVSLVTY